MPTGMEAAWTKKVLSDRPYSGTTVDDDRSLHLIGDFGGKCHDDQIRYIRSKPAESRYIILSGHKYDLRLFTYLFPTLISLFIDMVFIILLSVTVVLFTHVDICHDYLHCSMLCTMTLCN